MSFKLVIICPSSSIFSKKTSNSFLLQWRFSCRWLKRVTESIQSGVLFSVHKLWIIIISSLYLLLGMVMSLILSIFSNWISNFIFFNGGPWVESSTSALGLGHCLVLLDVKAPAHQPEFKLFSFSSLLTSFSKINHLMDNLSFFL